MHAHAHALTAIWPIGPRQHPTHGLVKPGRSCDGIATAWFLRLLHEVRGPLQRLLPLRGALGREAARCLCVALGRGAGAHGDSLGTSMGSVWDGYAETGHF